MRNTFLNLHGREIATISSDLVVPIGASEDGVWTLYEARLNGIKVGQVWAAMTDGVKPTFTFPAYDPQTFTTLL